MVSQLNRELADNDSQKEEKLKEAKEAAKEAAKEVNILQLTHLYFTNVELMVLKKEESDLKEVSNFFRFALSCV